jgi:anti-sigma factor RsiW
MIRCRELVELVTAYLDDALRPDERASIDAHLARCDGCTAYVQQFQTTIALIRRTRET